jgi:hypothetical protein
MKQPRLREWQLTRAGRWQLTRAARRAERKTGPSAAASDLPAIAAKADDLEEIKKSVEDAASVSGGRLFRSLPISRWRRAPSPMKIFCWNVLSNCPSSNCRSSPFFALAPFVVLIIHAYALMHFIMLGKKASRFHNAAAPVFRW